MNDAAAGRIDPAEIASLGLRSDPRVGPILRRIRDQRDPRTMWPAVLGLARFGDDSARTAWRTLVTDGRIAIIESALDDFRRDMCDDQRTLDAWTTWLAGSRRMHRTALYVLFGREPQCGGMPTDPDDLFYGDPVADVRRFRSLLDSGTLRRSRVSGGLVTSSGESGK
jgi:hypothetical protein